MNTSNPFQKVVLVGAGNVATHLGKAFQKTGSNIVQVYSRTTSSAITLASILGSEAISDLNKITQNADLYIIAVSDSVTKDILSKIQLKGNPIVIHTSGSLSMDILGNISKNYGVVYIPQTFVKNISLDYAGLHFCIEASNEQTLQELREYLKQISNYITNINSEQRTVLHLAAVMVSNFTNCLYGIADEILSKENLSLGILQPLINETAKKPMVGKPKDLQTGPAKRHDENIINQHLEMLKNNSDYLELYKLFTKIIQQND